jgi:predicted transcriptional regulator
VSDANLPKITAETIMTATVFTVTLDMTVRSAIEMLIEKKIAGAPVVDKQNVVVSVASEGDLLKLAATFGLEKPISECLTRLPKQEKLITIRRSEAFEKIYRIFLSHPVHRIIVCDDRGKLQGIVSRSNLLKTLVRSVEKPKEEAPEVKKEPDFHPATATETVTKKSA